MKCQPTKPVSFTMNVPLVGLGEMSADPASAVYLEILGCCYSMKNSKIGHFKHPKAIQFEKDFAIQVRPEHRKFLGGKERPLMTVIAVYYPSYRQDLDLSLVYDCMQANGIISNDRYIREKHEYAYVDSKNPRVSIYVEEV